MTCDFPLLSSPFFLNAYLHLMNQHQSHNELVRSRTNRQLFTLCSVTSSRPLESLLHCTARRAQRILCLGPLIPIFVCPWRIYARLDQHRTSSTFRQRRGSVSQPFLARATITFKSLGLKPIIIPSLRHRVTCGVPNLTQLSTLSLTWCASTLELENSQDDYGLDHINFPLGDYPH